MYNVAMNEIAKKYDSRAAGLTFSVLVVIYLIFSLIIGAIALGAGLNGTDGYLYLSYLVAPLSMVVGCAISLWFTKTPKKPLFKSAFNPKCGIKYYLFAVLLIFGLSFALGRLNSLITQKVFVPLGYKPRGSYLPALGGGLVVPAILVIAILPAVFEEFVFRGLILNGLNEGAGGICAIFISGFCFSLFHGSPEQTVYQFICGCSFALLALRAGSVLPCILAHFLNNAYIIICAACGAIGEDGNLVMAQWADIMLCVLGAVALAAAIIILIFDKKPIDKRRKGGVAGFFIFASVGIGLLALLWILSLAGVQ